MNLPSSLVLVIAKSSLHRHIEIFKKIVNSHNDIAAGRIEKFIAFLRVLRAYVKCT